MSLSDCVWWTKKSRTQAEKRLLSNDFYSQVILLWYSIFLVFYSIYGLKSASESQLFSVVMVALSVLVLCATLFVSNRSFKERSMLIKQCYEQLSIIYNKSSKPNYNECDLEIEYQNILSICENHKDIDYKCAVFNEYYCTPKAKRDGLTKTPTCVININVLFYYLFRCIVVMFLFVFPIGIFCFLR